jgi:hypothetical protein
MPRSRFECGSIDAILQILSLLGAAAIDVEIGGGDLYVTAGISYGVSERILGLRQDLGLRQEMHDAHPHILHSCTADAVPVQIKLDRASYSVQAHTSTAPAAFYLKIAHAVRPTKLRPD